MAKKDDDFVASDPDPKKSGSIMYVIIGVLVAALGTGGYFYTQNTATPTNAPTATPAGAPAATTTTAPVAPPVVAPPVAPSSVPIETVIYFDYDSAVVLEANKAKLQDFLKKIDGKNGEIKVEGHTDGKGAREYNKKLSDLRAEQTASNLRKLGLPDKYAVVARGLGMDKPAGDNSREEGRAKNRRAEITFAPSK